MIFSFVQVHDLLFDSFNFYWINFYLYLVFKSSKPVISFRQKIIALLFPIPKKKKISFYIQKRKMYLNFILKIRLKLIRLNNLNLC